MVERSARRVRRRSAFASFDEESWLDGLRKRLRTSIWAQPDDGAALLDGDTTPQDVRVPAPPDECIPEDPAAKAHMQRTAEAMQELMELGGIVDEEQGAPIRVNTFAEQVWRVDQPAEEAPASSLFAAFERGRGVDIDALLAFRMEQASEAPALAQPAQSNARPLIEEIHGSAMSAGTASDASTSATESSSEESETEGSTDADLSEEHELGLPSMFDARARDEHAREAMSVSPREEEQVSLHAEHAAIMVLSDSDDEPRALVASIHEGAGDTSEELLDEELSEGLDDALEEELDLAVDDVLEDLAVDDASEDLAVDDVSEDLAVDDASEDPAVDDASEDLAVDDVSEDLAVDDASEDLAVDDASEDLAVDDGAADLAVYPQQRSLHDSDPTSSAAAINEPNAFAALGNALYTHEPAMLDRDDHDASSHTHTSDASLQENESDELEQGLDDETLEQQGTLSDHAGESDEEILEEQASISDDESEAGVILAEEQVPDQENFETHELAVGEDAYLEEDDPAEEHENSPMAQETLAEEHRSPAVAHSVGEMAVLQDESTDALDTEEQDLLDTASASPVSTTELDAVGAASDALQEHLEDHAEDYHRIPLDLSAHDADDRGTQYDTELSASLFAKELVSEMELESTLASHERTDLEDPWDSFTHSMNTGHVPMPEILLDADAPAATPTSEGQPRESLSPSLPTAYPLMEATEAGDVLMCDTEQAASARIHELGSEPLPVWTERVEAGTQQPTPHEALDRSSSADPSADAARAHDASSPAAHEAASAASTPRRDHDAVWRSPSHAHGETGPITRSHCAWQRLTLAGETDTPSFIVRSCVMDPAILAQEHAETAEMLSDTDSLLPLDANALPEPIYHTLCRIVGPSMLDAVYVVPNSLPAQWMEDKSDTESITSSGGARRPSTSPPPRLVQTYARRHRRPRISDPSSPAADYLPYSPGRTPRKPMDGSVAELEKLPEPESPPKMRLRTARERRRTRRYSPP